jgi:hypothetical protein
MDDEEEGMELENQDVEDHDHDDHVTRRRRYGGEDDDDSIVARSDGSEDEEEEDESGEDPRRTKGDANRDDNDVEILDPVDEIQPGFAGLDMEWGDDAEEGMGMEDFGEEEGLDLDRGQEPDSMLGKRKGKGATSKANVSGKIAPVKVDKMDKCPVCGISLKGKVNNASLRLHALTFRASTHIYRLPSNTSTLV